MSTETEPPENVDAEPAEEPATAPAAEPSPPSAEAAEAAEETPPFEVTPERPDPNRIEPAEGDAG